MEATGVNLTDAQADKIDELADEHDTTRTAVMRSLLENGLRARKYYPDEFEIHPKNHEQADAVELAREGRLPR